MATTSWVQSSPLKEHTHTVILLHELGNNGDTFCSNFFSHPKVGQRSLSEIYPTIKWIFVSAKLGDPARFEEPIPQWFNMWNFREPESRKDLQARGLITSIRSIRELIKDESDNVPEERIFLGGHSQGCATAILLLLAGGTRLGGFIGLCGWLPFEKEIRAIAEAIFEGSAPTNSLAIKLRDFFEFPWDPFPSESALATPVLLSHSQDNEIVPFEHGEKLCEILRLLGMSVTRKTHPEGEEWTYAHDIARFINSHALNEVKQSTDRVLDGVL